MKLTYHSIILMLLLVLITIPCFSKRDYIPLSSGDGKLKYVNGLEYTEIIKNNIKIWIRYDKLDWPYIAFDIIVINDTMNEMLFNPADSYYIPINEQTQVENSLIEDGQVEHVTAYDPEFGYYKNIHEEYPADDSGDEIMDSCGGCLAGTVETTSKDKEAVRNAKETQREIDERIEKRKIEREKNINSFNYEKDEFEKNLIKKTTILPGEKVPGKIYYPAESALNGMKIVFPFEKILIEIVFKSTVKVANNNKVSAMSNSSDVNSTDKNGRTALMMASGKGDFEQVKLLINKNADLNIADENGFTALHYATISDRTNIVKLILSIKSFNAINYQTNDGSTALIMAAMLGRAEIVKILLENGAEKDIQDKKNRTALTYAQRSKYKDIVELLK